MAAILVACPAFAFDLQGHRGARGLAPENTLAAFAKALEIGVTTLELDTGITRDGIVVVSHNPELNPDITRDADGRFLTASGPAIHSLTLAELRRFDIGRLNPATSYARGFPDQRPADGARIPTLAEVFDLARRAGNADVRFNVETKIFPDRPALTPAPDAFADALVALIRAEGMSRRATIQSFDWRTLRRVQASAPEIETVYLSAEQRFLDNIERGRPGPSPWTAGFDVDEYAGSVPRLVHAAGGRIWSPFYVDATPEVLAEAKRLGLRVIVWTVNDPMEMDRLIERGVDGIISDRPDILRRVMAARGLALPVPTPLSR